jgi:hypothetical protein
LRKSLAFLVTGAICIASGALLAPAQTAAQNPGQAPTQQMSFFLTSVGAGHGANFGGIAGADTHCQALADGVGAGDRIWHAYLSNQARPGSPAINARDRIGSGPWYNAHGVLLASDVEALHSEPTNMRKEIALNENGETVGGTGDPAHEDDKTWAHMQAHPRSVRHEILTGSTPEGRAFVSTPARALKSESMTNPVHGIRMVLAAAAIMKGLPAAMAQGSFTALRLIEAKRDSRK